MCYKCSICWKALSCQRSFVRTIKQSQATIQAMFRQAHCKVWKSLIKAIIHVYNQQRKHFIFGLREQHKGKLNEAATSYIRKCDSFTTIFWMLHSTVYTHNSTDHLRITASKKMKGVWKLQETWQLDKLIFSVLCTCAICTNISHFLQYYRGRLSLPLISHKSDPYTHGFDSHSIIEKFDQHVKQGITVRVCITLGP